ncbi:MAG: carboxypeptidase-like regulatory domain-containing protein [Myxococcota bacterium]
MIAVYSLFMLVNGCALNNEASRAEDADGTSAAEDASDAFTPGEGPTTIWVDVFPTNTLLGETPDDGLRALPKTSRMFEVDSVDVEVGRVQLDAPIRFTGRVEGFRLNPQISSLPGEFVAVPATVQLTLPGTVQDYTVTTDENGEFGAWVGPRTVYALSVVPDDASFPSFADVLPLTDSARDLELTLPIAPPVFGRVASGLGPIENASVFLIDEEGRHSGIAFTDEDGWYTVRAMPGTYDVVCDGGPASARDPRPVITYRDIEVGELGAQRDFNYIDSPSALVTGRVLSEDDGVDMGGVEVRFTSDRLTVYADVEASWSFTARLQQNNEIIARVIPGIYDIEVIPPALDVDPDDGLDFALQPSATPVRLSEVSLTMTEKPLPDIVLTNSELVLGTVVDESAAVVEAARVTCTEQGFGSRQWSGLTDVLGLFEMQLPAVPVRCRITPPGTSGLASADFDFTPVTDGDNTPSFTLPEGIVIRGEVTGPTGEPESFAAITIRREIDDAILATGLTNDEGRYAIRIAP